MYLVQKITNYDSIEIDPYVYSDFETAKLRFLALLGEFMLDCYLDAECVEGESIKDLRTGMEYCSGAYIEDNDGNKILFIAQESSFNGAYFYSSNLEQDMKPNMWITFTRID